MPIRHCQKCGLKVLIDETQTTANPFYCQRCAATAKAQAAAPEAKRADPMPMVSKRDPASAPGSAPVTGGGKGGPVKVLCPYCKASFSGRLPAKPAKGACPVCQKELVLLPDGKIKPAATFDLAKWQKEQELAKYGGDPGVAEQARAVQKALERSNRDLEIPPPESEGIDPEATATSDDGGSYSNENEATLITPRASAADPLSGLGGETMLDMGRPIDTGDNAGRRAAQEERDPLAVLGDDAPLEGDPNAATIVDDPPPVPQEAEAIEQEVPTIKQVPESAPALSRRPAPAASRSPLPPVTAPAAEPEARTPATPGSLRSGPSGAKVVFAALLLIIPVALGGVGIFVKNNAELNKLLGKLGPIGSQGFRKLREKVDAAMTPPPKPAPPPKPVAPPTTATEAPPPVPKLSDADFKRQTEPIITDMWTTMRFAQLEIKKLQRDPTGSHGKAIEFQQQKHDSAKKRYDELQAEYKERFGAEFKAADQ